MAEDNNSPWQYKPDDSPENVDVPDDDVQDPVASESKQKTVAWQATEFIEHHHGSSWYAVLALSTLAIAAIVFFSSSHDYIAAFIILVLGAVVGMYASHKPGTASYEITHDGLKINDKTYRYGDYKSFAVINEGDLSSVNLIPLKRFLPPVSAYFDNKDEQKITNALGGHLPYEPRQLDSIERLSRRLRL